MRGENMESKSRADYLKERRKTRKIFNVEIERDKLIKFEEFLQKHGKTKTHWLSEKIDEELEEYPEEEKMLNYIFEKTKAKKSNVFRVGIQMVYKKLKEELDGVEQKNAARIPIRRWEES